jgi:hypothetical protein
MMMEFCICIDTVTVWLCANKVLMSYNLLNILSLFTEKNQKKKEHHFANNYMINFNEYKI